MFNFVAEILRINKAETPSIFGPIWEQDMLEKQVACIQNKVVHLTNLPHGLNLPYRNKSIRV